MRTRAWWLIGCVVASGPAVLTSQGSDTALVSRGREVYREQRCAACHSVGGVGNRRYPLDSAGRLDTLILRQWVVAPQRVQPRVRKRAYDHLPEADIRALVAWLRTLRVTRPPSTGGGPPA